MRSSGVGAAALLVLSACASAARPAPAPLPQAATPSPAASGADQAAPSKLDPQAPPRIEAPTYVLELASPAHASTSESTEVTVTLEGRGGYHVNLEFPARIELGGSALVFEKTVLSVADAAEMTEARASWKAQVRWSAAGAHWIGARVQFAVCTPDTCVPEQQMLAIAVQVR